MTDLILGSLHVVALSLFKHRHSASFQNCWILSGNLISHKIFPQRLSPWGSFNLLLASSFSSKVIISWEQILLQLPLFGCLQYPKLFLKQHVTWLKLELSDCFSWDMEEQGRMVLANSSDFAWSPTHGEWREERWWVICSLPNPSFSLFLFPSLLSFYKHIQCWVCTRHCARHCVIWIWHCCLLSRRFESSGEQVVSVVKHCRNLWRVRVLWDYGGEQLYQMAGYQRWLLGGSAPWAEFKRINGVNKKGNKEKKVFLLEGRICTMAGRHKIAEAVGSFQFIISEFEA